MLDLDLYIFTEPNYIRSSFQLRSTIYGVSVDLTCIQSHKGLSICDGYHEPIRTVVIKMMVEPNPYFKLLLTLAVKIN